MRLHAHCLLAHILLGLVTATAAPVPKGAGQPAGLSPDQVIGTWEYEWGNRPAGRITFDRDNSYSAYHDPAGGTVYAGSWKCDNHSVTITEWSYSAATGELRGGPTEYVFDFGETKCPNLSGVSNGTVRVALARPK